MGVGVGGAVVELGGVAVAAGDDAVAVADAYGEFDGAGSVSCPGGVGAYVDRVVDEQLGVGVG